MFELSNPLTLSLGLLAIVSTLLYLREYNLRNRMSRRGEKVLEALEQKSFQTLHQSIKKSQDILGEAELEGVKVVAESKVATQKLEEDYSHQLAEMINQSESKIREAQAQLLHFMSDIQKRSQDFELASQTATQERINQMFDRLETRLDDFLISTAQKTISSIDMELRSARQLVEGYKQQQLALIDENILAMMEQTLNLVLGKKLSLKDQLDLIYEALEKAKVEKFIV